MTKPVVTVPSAASGDFNVSWTASSLNPSTPAGNTQINYTVDRSGDGGTTWVGACGGGTINALTCQESGLATGNYIYRVTAHLHSWTEVSDPSTSVNYTAAGGGDAQAPTVQSINRFNPAEEGTNANSVTWRVTFSETVTGVDATDFALAPTVTGAGSISVSPVSESVYDVSASTGSGNGTLGLDLVEVDRSIKDAAGNELGGNTIGDGNFTNGDTYTIDKIKPSSQIAAGAVADITSGTTFTVPYTANDNPDPISSLSKVELYVDTPAVGGFTLAATDDTPTAGENFSYTDATVDGTYGFYTVAYDDAGNVEDAPGVADDTATRDTVGPAIDRAIIVKSLDRPHGTGEVIRQGGGYFVYAQVTPRPGLTVTDVSADVSSITTAASDVQLDACSGANCTINGLTYNYVSQTQTANGSLTGVVKNFAVTAEDNLTRTTTGTFSVTVDNTRPTVSSVSTTGDNDGKPEIGETIRFTYSSPVEGTSLFSPASTWVWPFSSMSVRAAFIQRNNNPDRFAVTAGATFTIPSGLGLVELGSEGYLTGGNNDEVRFGGTGAATQSTIQRSGNEIIVTLGSQNGATGSGALPSSGPASSTIIWSGGSGSAYDAAGNSVNTTPATASSPNEAQF